MRERDIATIDRQVQDDPWCRVIDREAVGRVEDGVPHDAGIAEDIVRIDTGLRELPGVVVERDECAHVHLLIGAPIASEVERDLAVGP